MEPYNSNSFTNLMKCPYCQRSFCEASFDKHKSVCSRPTRKPFNTQALRCREVNEKLQQIRQSRDDFNKWGGGFILKSSESQVNTPSTIECNYCSRTFAYESGIKHIKICEQNALKKGFKKSNGPINQKISKSQNENQLVSKLTSNKENNMKKDTIKTSNLNTTVNKQQKIVKNSLTSNLKITKTEQTKSPTMQQLSKPVLHQFSSSKASTLTKPLKMTPTTTLPRSQSKSRKS